MGTQEHAAVTAGGDPTGIEIFQPDCYVLGFREIGATQVAVVGGKARTWGSCRTSKAFACRLASA
jgi:hypothetical protein